MQPVQILDLPQSQFPAWPEFKDWNLSGLCVSLVLPWRLQLVMNVLSTAFKKAAGREDGPARLSENTFAKLPSGFPPPTWTDGLIHQQSDLIACRAHSLFLTPPPHRPFLDLRTAAQLKRSWRVAQPATAPPAAVWSARTSSARHLEMRSSLPFFLFSWGRSCQMCTLRRRGFDWRLSHFTRSGVFGSGAASAAASPAPLQRSSSSPSLLCSWESDFSLPCRCYSLAETSKGAGQFFPETKCYFSF